MTSRACPQLFKFRAIDHLPEPVTVYQARGTTAHRALQRLFDLPAEQRTPEALYDLFRAAWAEARATEEYEGLFASVEEERAWGLESLAILANYFAVEDPASFDPLEREMDLLEDLDGITIRGILDRMEDRPDGSLVISDYKTGKAPPEQYALPAFFALKIYALLIRRRTGRTPDAVRLIYLGGPNGPVVYEIPVSDAQLDAMDRQLRRPVVGHRPGHRPRRLPPAARAAVRLVLLPQPLPGLVGAVAAIEPAAGGRPAD